MNMRRAQERPGLLALIVLFLLAEYPFTPPHPSLGPPSKMEATGLVIVTLVGQQGLKCLLLKQVATAS